MFAPATLLRWLSALALAFALTTPSFAQEAGEEAAEAEPAAEPQPAPEAGYSGVEEITITATKRAQSVQDVPIAVTAITAEGLQARGISDVKDLQQVAPSLTVTDSNSSTNGGTIRIRGMGTSGNNPGLESAVGSFIDGVYRSRSGLALQDLIDVERVEILRGPQGTLFGKNTSAGLIHIITKLPEWEWGGYVRGTLGNFDMRKVEASATGPVINEKLAFRLAGSLHQRDGYYDDIDSKDTFSDRDRWALKGQFLWTPTDNFDARLIADYTKMREHCCPAVETTVGLNGVILQNLFGAVFPNPSGHETLDVGTNNDPAEDVNDWGLSLETNWDLDWVRIKSILAHRQTDIFRTQDIDFTNADILRPGDTDENWENWSLEFQAGGNVEGLLDLDWLVGWYGYSEDLLNAGQVRLATQAPGYIQELVRRSIGNPFFPFANRFNADEGRSSVHHQDTKGWSIFTHDIFHPTERLSFTIGARYGWERKEGSGIHNGAPPGTISSAPFCDRITNGPPTTQAFVGLRNTLSNTCDNFSWEDAFVKRNWAGTLQLGYAFNDDINGYVSVSRGFKAGGFNLDADAFNCEAVQIDNFGDPGPDPNDGTLAVLSGASPGGGIYCYPRDSTKFGPETTYNYEVGLKSQFFDNRVTANLAVFYTDFKGFQLNQFTGLGFIIRNVELVVAKGAELEVTAYPWEGVIGNFSITYADTRYGDDIGDVCFELQYPDLSVNRCPNNLATGGLDTPPGGGAPQANVFPNDQIADGKQITQAPAFSGSLSLSIQRPFLNTGWSWYGGGNLYYRGRHKTSSDLDSRKAQEAYTKLNLQAGFRSPGERVDIQAWANNVTDEIVTTGYFDSVFQGGSISAFRQSPRMYGVTATYHFGE